MTSARRWSTLVTARRARDMTQQEILSKREYRERGFVIVRRILRAEEVQALKMEVDRYVREVVPLLPASDAVREKDGQRIRNLFRMDVHDPFFRHLGETPRFLALLESLIDDSPVLRAVQTFNKPARVGSAVPQHQDNAYFMLFPPTAATLWIAVDGATAENGAVEYVVGSHKLGSLEHRYSGQPGNSMMMKEPLDPSRFEIVKAELEPGDAVIHDCRTVHFSGPNRSALPRLGMVTPYQGQRVRPDPDLKRLYDEVAAIVRGPLYH